MAPRVQFIHENEDRVREHAAQILKNPAAVKQMSKNTFQLPPLANPADKQLRRDNQDKLTDEFYSMLK